MSSKIICKASDPKLPGLETLKNVQNMLSLLDFKYHLKYCGHPKDV